MKKVAIVGSGPSGFYAAEALLKQKDYPVSIDMFDRLPTPYGLVRGGVAPDHQKIKGVIAVYEKTASNPAFRFFGNVKIGRDLTADDLRRLYHQIVYAVGNESDRKLGVPGEDLAGNHSATSFVGWYNSHPDYRNENFDLSKEAVAVVGIGNVAMDVTRILAEDPSRLEKTDIAGYALEALKSSRVKTIYLLGRRGPAQAAFSPAEIQEIGSLESSDLVVLPNEAAVDEASQNDLKESESKRNFDYVAAKAAAGEGTKSKKVRLRFCVSPVEALGGNGQIKALKIEKNRLVSDDKGRAAAVGTGQFEEIPVGLVFRAVGYRGIALPGVSFDQKRGIIPNDRGRVLNPSGQPAAGEYVVGWAKRGPSGLIGTNRADSAATVSAMIEDARLGRVTAATAADDAAPLLQSKGVRAVSFSDWKSLDRIEVERGAKMGKIRDKFSSVDSMIEALGAAAKV